MRKFDEYTYKVMKMLQCLHYLAGMYSKVEEMLWELEWLYFYSTEIYKQQYRVICQ